jgi:Arc-like DNA binding domain
MPSKRRGPVRGSGSSPPPELRPIMVRLPEKLRQRLAQLAEKEGRSMNAEIIHRLEQATEGPSIETSLQNFWRTLQAQQKVMQEQDERAGPPRKELQQLREELQKINSVMNDIRNDYLDLFDRLRKPEDGEQK